MRDGEPRLHNACCFDIPCAQYAPAPLPRGWKKGDRIPEHHMPSPDDYAFAHLRVDPDQHLATSASEGEGQWPDNTLVVILTGRVETLRGEWGER